MIRKFPVIRYIQIRVSSCRFTSLFLSFYRFNFVLLLAQLFTPCTVDVNFRNGWVGLWFFTWSRSLFYSVTFTYKPIWRKRRLNLRQKTVRVMELPILVVKELNQKITMSFAMEVVMCWLHQNITYVPGNKP